MRQIVLDTETTGLDPAAGHRIIEIGCVEIKARRVSRNRFHQYLNPEREVDQGAMEVHGLRREDLEASPRFCEVVDEFLEFIRGAELIIHNAPFDVGFLNAELARLDGDRGAIEEICTITDTLTLARETHPGQRNSLDALCKRYEIDNTHRELHGALLDAELLADVYLLLTGGQADLVLEQAAARGGLEALGSVRPTRLVRAALNAAELEAHERLLDRVQEMSGACLWRTAGKDPGPAAPG